MVLLKKSPPQFQNIGILEKIYPLYEKAMAETKVVCREKCADCCTCNVVVTSLETAFILHSMDTESLADLKQRLEEKFPVKRYIPKMTTNQFAAYCLSGQEIPDEENNPDWGKCPFLEEDCCTLYLLRPFGCRSMMSQVNCGKTGYAQVPPLALTITNIFLQYIEHLDYKGFSGNLSDMLALDIHNYEKPDTPRLFIRNMKIPRLMVPPEHRSAVAPLLKQIAALT